MSEPRIEFVPLPEVEGEGPFAGLVDAAWRPPRDGVHDEVVVEVPEVVVEVPEVIPEPVDQAPPTSDELTVEQPVEPPVAEAPVPEAPVPEPTVGGLPEHEVLDVASPRDLGAVTEAVAEDAPEAGAGFGTDLGTDLETGTGTDLETGTGTRTDLGTEPEPEPEPDLETDAGAGAAGSGDPFRRRAATPASSVASSPFGTSAPSVTLADVRLPPVPPTTSPGSGQSDGLRRWSIPSRVLFLATASVVVAGLVALVAIWGVSRSASVANDLSANGEASRAAAELSGALAAVRTATPEQMTVQVARVEELVGIVVRTTPGGIDPEVLGGLQDATTSLADMAGDSAVAVNPEPLREAAVATSGRAAEVLELLGSQRGFLTDEADSARTATIVGILVALLAGTLVLVGLTRVVTGSIVGPLRLLGRTMRRFADGDTGARSSEGIDEVGLLARSFNYSAATVGARIDRLSADAARGTQLRLVSDALDLADDEADVHRIVARAFGILVPDHAAELMVHDTASSHLQEVAVHPRAGSPGCPVESTSGCVAMRRAQALTFDSPNAINACPQLRDRDQPCSAACVPVSVNGHLLGVMHVTAPEGHPPAPELVDQLVTLAGQVGTRIGAMRTLEVTRLQASTDGLTGLANRRMLEARVGDLLRNATPFVLAVADLDHFTQINNNYGHEAGDKALQLFAGVLQDNVRGHDIVARIGGEEFVLVYPEISVTSSMEALERIRAALARAIERSGLPPFTCSFGVTHSSVADSLESVIRIADAGLLTAKDMGRNRVVYADEEMAAEVFGAGADGPSPQRSSPEGVEGPEGPESP